jgi:hypothetical protein
MRQTPTLDIQPERDPLATIAVSAAPVVLEGRYRLLIRALWQLRHSRRTRWGVGLRFRPLGVSPDFLAEHVLPELRVIRRGRLVLIPVSELERWCDRSAARTLEGHEP